MSKSRTSNNQPSSPGLLVVFSAPSGAGKSTVLQRLRARETNLAATISATTRPPRQGEVQGVDYYFLSTADFRQRIAENALVEWAEVHGNLYGTLKSELQRIREAGRDVLLEIDVQGMRLIRAQYPELVSIFLMPPSLEALAERLRKRGTDDEATIQLRLKNAQTEMAARDEYSYVVVNDDLARAVTEIRAILDYERRQLATFPIQAQP